MMTVQEPIALCTVQESQCNVKSCSVPKKVYDIFLQAITHNPKSQLGF